MKTSKKVSILFLIAILLLMILIGCGSKPTLVGKWYSEEKNLYITFSEGGTVKMGDDILQYEAISEDELVIGDGFGDNEIYEYYFSSGKLYIERSEFIREK